jgi:hypothetical protein
MMPLMSGRRISRRTARIALRAVALDAFLVLLRRYGFRQPWHGALVLGAVLAGVSAVTVAYSVWWDRHPEFERRQLAKTEAKRARRAERTLREAQADRAAVRRRDR